MDLLKKYKVSKLDDIYGHNEVKKFFKGFVGNFWEYPCAYFFEGDYGVGKTSFVYAIRNELKERYNDVVFEFLEYDSTKLNKDNINDLCEIVLTKYCLMKNKVFLILFEEIQGIIKKETQDSLLKLLEAGLNNVYYFFTTTKIDKIVDTLLSRCLVFRLNVLDRDEVGRFLDMVIRNEGVVIDKVVRDKIVCKSKGHLRDCLKLLNVYINIKDKDEFDYFIKDSVNDLVLFFRGEVDEGVFYKYNLNLLVDDLSDFLYNYINGNLSKENLNKIIKIIEIFVRLKYYIYDINDFIFIIKLIKQVF